MVSHLVSTDYGHLEMDLKKVSLTITKKLLTIFVCDHRSQHK